MNSSLPAALVTLSDNDEEKYIDRQILLTQLLEQSTMHATFDNLGRYDEGVIDRGDDVITEHTAVSFLGLIRESDGNAQLLVAFRGRSSGERGFGWITPSAQSMQVHPMNELVFTLDDTQFDRLFALKAAMDKRQRREAQTQPVEAVTG